MWNCSLNGSASNTDNCVISQRPSQTKRPLLRSPSFKASGRLSSSSSVVSSLSTPVPTLRHGIKERKDLFDDENEHVGVTEIQHPLSQSGGLEESLQGPFWKNVGDTDDTDEEIIGTDDEDAEEQFDKSNSQYVLSLPENPPPSRRLMLYKTQQPPTFPMESPQAQGSARTGSSQYSQARPKAEKQDNSIGVIAADLLRDLSDEDDENVTELVASTEDTRVTTSSLAQEVSNMCRLSLTSPSPLPPSSSGSTQGIDKNASQPHSSYLGLQLLTDYFDEDTEETVSHSTTTAEAMKLLTDSLGGREMNSGEQQ